MDHLVFYFRQLYTGEVTIRMGLCFAAGWSKDQNTDLKKPNGILLSLYQINKKNAGLIGQTTQFEIP